MFEWNEAKPLRWGDLRRSYADYARRSREQNEGWAGIVSLVMLNAMIVGLAWAIFYGPGLQADGFLYQNAPPDPDMGKYYRWVGWGLIGIGGWTVLSNFFIAGREGMGLGRYVKSLWVAATLVLAGVLAHAAAHQYDRWFAIHGAMTVEEIEAASAWTGPGLPKLEELF
ncbi:hypothetical protein K3163_06230 [Qipengyuania sp. 1NDW9]|uniref:hypothetical protein n=1 Tax=Qipengyuania xiapuensis TaxID=2867236 RepID=UPI001C88681D|nr:hypothetical protein [Qipengyuania xiapuensis]MBX7492800.1 hypothetical protein [Qipengyuania xiapuensis]